MKATRKLALRRETLTALDPAALGAVGGGVPATDGCPPVSDTCYSCLDYVSCRIAECLLTVGRA